MRKKGQFLFLFALCLPLLPALSSCTRREREPVRITERDAREGDLVFRRGLSRHSRAVTLLRGRYSHVGIVVDSGGGRLRVVHAVPDEPDRPGEPDKVKMERMESYFSAERAEEGCLMRMDDSIAARAAARVAMRFWRRGTPFDGAFDETDTTAMYCTELVAYAYRHAGHDIAGKERHPLPLPWAKGDCLLPDHLLRCPLLRRVK